ncbi:MAG: c-type cytochrome [Isosphaeraceae bacterium]
MPATDETYYRLPAMHTVFAITSIGMLLAIVWMIMADHLRPWKQTQREFQQVETAKLRAQEELRLHEQETKHQTEIDRIKREVAEANQHASENRGLIRAKEVEIDRTKGRFQQLDIEKRFTKAELDSQRSIYDGYISRDDRASASRYLVEKIVPTEQKLTTLTVQYEEVDETLLNLKNELADLRGHVDEKAKRMDDLTRDVARVRRTLEQKQAQYGQGGVISRLLAAVRGMPIIDLAAPPTKIQQISLPELTINYNFKDVPRYDRCTTCHQGIDRIGYDKDIDGKTPMTKNHPAFAAHPHLTDGALTVDPKGRTVTAGLYLDANGPHPINSFGCTICHGGQGSGTSFTNASHEPNSLLERTRWEEEHSYREMHHWDEPMLPTRFLQSSCIKCHHQVTDIPEVEAPKLRAGYERITKYGCTGCHTIGGDGSFGPDLTDARQIGPNLKHLGSKVSKDWAAKWIKNPHAFRPDTRMPRFYEVSNNDAPEDRPKIHAEVQAITHYLFATSTPPQGFVDPPAKSDADHGKTLFLEKGCLACHTHADYGPDAFPEEARAVAKAYSKADFGPNLSTVAAKFPKGDQGYKWLANWIHAPDSYHPKTLMPNLQLSMQDAADIAAWLLSVTSETPERWDDPEFQVPAVDSPEVTQGLNELVSLYLSKAKIYKKPGTDTTRTVLLAEVKDVVGAMSPDEKLMYVGEKTISRLGCFGCHNIKGFESAKPIGTPLNGWGFKSPAKLDFAHITEYIGDQKRVEDGSRDGTSEYYQDKLASHLRSGFLYQKLHRPRSYDYQKTKESLKSWDDRLRMPQFAWADDPEAIEEVMTFVLGLTGEKVAARYLPKTHTTPTRTAIARGERLLIRYNCKGCHVLEMPKYTVPAGIKIADALPDLEINLEVSYGDRSKDFKAFIPGLTFDPEQVPSVEELEPDAEDRGDVTLIGMPTASIEDEVDGEPVTKVSVQLWRPATVLGYTFNVGDKITIIPEKMRKTASDGGDFAWLYATTQAAESGSDFASYWNRLPPPLLREGLKVQTPWLTNLLKDPYPIRPAAQLRMPRFHFGATLAEQGQSTEGEELSADAVARLEAQGETRDLANYFAAVDGAEFPYQDIPQRDRNYLAEREAKHPDYLAGGWSLTTKGLCVQCHAIGSFQPSGGAAVINGPDLRQVGDRFRPDYLAEWLGNPQRLVPYTAMPQNIPPHPAEGSPATPGVPKSFEGQPLDQVLSIRDTLLNYTTAVENQLIAREKQDKTEEPKTAEKKAEVPSGGGR